MPLEDTQPTKPIIPFQLLGEEHRELREMVEEGTLTPEGALSMLGIVPGKTEKRTISPEKETNIAQQTRIAINAELAKNPPKRRRSYPIPMTPRLEPVDDYSVDDNTPDTKRKRKKAPAETPKPTANRIRTRRSVLNTILKSFDSSSDISLVAEVLLLTTQNKASRLSINEIYELLLRKSEDNMGLTPEKIKLILDSLPKILSDKGIVVHIKAEMKFRRNRAEIGYWLTIQ